MLQPQSKTKGSSTYWKLFPEQKDARGRLRRGQPQLTAAVVATTATWAPKDVSQLAFNEK